MHGSEAIQHRSLNSHNTIQSLMCLFGSNGLKSAISTIPETFQSQLRACVGGDSGAGVLSC